MSDYEIIEQRIKDVQTAIGLAADVEDVRHVCVLLLDLIRRVHRKDAPQ